MELGKRIHDYRMAANMNQDELAEKVYVSRQTISSWENDKSYPDIHSLLMLSEIFDVTLDQLVKGDIEIMKEQINQTTINTFNRDSNIFAVLMLIMVVSAVPLGRFLGIPGMVIWFFILVITFVYAFRIEKMKKQFDIHTYKEIVAFCNGEKLDAIQKAREDGKRGYQKIILVLSMAVISFIICFIIGAIIG